MESLSSLSAMQHREHRASLTHPRLLARDSARLNRSNSIRSTKSEKMYLQRSAEDPGVLAGSMPLGTLGSSPSMSGLPHHHSSQPTSPTAGQLGQGASRFNYNLSSISTSASTHGLSRNSMSPYSGMMKVNSKDDDGEHEVKRYSVGDTPGPGPGSGVYPCWYRRPVRILGFPPRCVPPAF